MAIETKRQGEVGWLFTHGAAFNFTEITQ